MKLFLLAGADGLDDLQNRIWIGCVEKKFKDGGLEDVTLRLSRPSVHGGNS